MRKSIVAVVAAAVALTMSSFAADPKPEAKPAGPKNHEYTGDVKAVDTVKHSLTVSKKEGDEKTFILAEKCKIVAKEKEAAELGDLKTGDHVTVRFTEEGGKNLANKIAPPDKKKPTEKKPAEKKAK